MPVSFVDHGAGFFQATYKTLDLFILCVVAIAVALSTFTHSVNATNLEAGIYISPAAAPVRSEPLADISATERLATGPPSRILLTGKTNVATHDQLPRQSIVGNAETNSTGDEISIAPLGNVPKYMNLD